MAQTSVTSYFNNRKRVANDEYGGIRNKIIILDQESDVAFPSNHSGKVVEKISHTETSKVVTKLKFDEPSKNADSTRKKREKITGTVRVTRTSKKSIIDDKQEKIVKFIKMGMLSPRKNISPMKNQINSTTLNAFSSLESLANVDRGMKTPTKSTKIMEHLNSMPIEEVQKKITKSSRLAELKASMAKIQELDKKLKKSEDDRKAADAPKTLKEFKSIELEILSPTKQFSSPRKLLPTTPQKYVLDIMSPRKLAPQKIIFSPSKLERTPVKSVHSSPSSLKFSPTKMPAYQKYQGLAESSRTGLPLPFKYRCLSEMFKCCESVCAMFHNRRETITFKKLKPAVQRMLRKNFTENNLAQIQHLYPEAYKFTQVKMRNFGSATKHDTYQLVITPNVKDNTLLVLGKEYADNVIKSAQNLIMNPQVIIERQNHFNKILTEKVLIEHEKFLRSLVPPIMVERNQIKRWHAEFDLENCPDIERGVLPQPPNVDKFSSAKDILSTARNLFNCATTMERAMDRLEAKKKEDPNIEEKLKNPFEKKNEQHSSLLKGIPKSLLEKIRAKQTAKALDAMTRRPSQDLETMKYRRLPDLTKHIRNVFVTEKKSILPLDIVLEKMGNSYPGILTNEEFEEHMKLISTEIPDWLSFHEIRKTRYIKIAKDIDINKVIGKLETITEEKSK